MEYSSTWLRPPSFENERFSDSGIFSADVHAARFRPHFFLFSHFGCFMLFVLAWSVSSHRWNGKTRERWDLLGNRKRKIRFGNIPNFRSKKNRRFRILVKVFVIILLRKSKHEIPHKITTNLGPETRHILQNRILQKLPRWLLVKFYRSKTLTRK